MAVKLRFNRMGRSHKAFFRLSAVDSRSPRDGRIIENLGFYDPVHKDETKQITIDLDRAKYWLDQGAVPSPTVSSLLKKQGIEHRMLKLRKHVTPKPKVEAPAEEKAAS